MKLLNRIVPILIIGLCCLLLPACSKNDNNTLFNNSTIITGYAYIKDATISKIPVPFKNQTIYLNTGTADTSSHVFQTTTDTTGYFSIPYLTKKSYTLFGHYYGTTKYYTGLTSVTLTKSTPIQSVFLYLAPAPPTNEDILFFVDSAGGSLSYLPFSIYTSSVLAAVYGDSTASKYAYLNGVSDSTGHYKLFNAGYNESYFIIASLKLGSRNLTAFDSIKIVDTSKHFTIRLSYAAKR